MNPEIYLEACRQGPASTAALTDMSPHGVVTEVTTLGGCHSFKGDVRYGKTFVEYFGRNQTMDVDQVVR